MNDPMKTKGTSLRSRSDLAAEIRDNTRITLAIAHASGIADDANARRNIVDTANGNPAQRSSYTDPDSGNTGPGGTVELDENLLNGMINLAEAYMLSVSEIAGGVHSNNSPHYQGLAIDVTHINGVRVSSTNPHSRVRTRASASPRVRHTRFSAPATPATTPTLTWCGLPGSRPPTPAAGARRRSIPRSRIRFRTPASVAISDLDHRPWSGSRPADQVDSADGED